MRSEILSEDGLPLGLVVSSWSFAQIGYFWSADFWGGAISHNAFRSRRWGRCLFIGIVVVGGILAVMAGPVSAVLMLPIRSEWPVGGGIGWMNGAISPILRTHTISHSKLTSPKEATSNSSLQSSMQSTTSTWTAPHRSVSSAGGLRVHPQAFLPSITYSARADGSPTPLPTSMSGTP